MTLQSAERRRESVVLVVCCAALFMTTLDGTVLNVALPSLQRELHATPSQLQWTVDGYTLFRACSIFLCGSIADRFGRKRVFIAGLVMFTVGSLASGLAPSLSLLIAFRCFQGFGSAVLTPSSLAIITNTFTDQVRRSWAIGMWNVAAGISTTGGPIIGGFLVQLFGWRSVFLVNLPFGVAALFGTRVVAESKSPTVHRFDVPGQLAIAVGLATLTYALITAPVDGWGSTTVLGLFAVAGACFLAFVVIERRSDHPLIPLHYLARPTLSGAALLAIVSFAAIGGFQFLNTLYLQEVRGFSPLEAGLLSFPLAAAVVVFSPLSGRMTGVDGPRRPAVLAMVSLSLGMGIITAVIGLATSIVLLLFIYLLLGTGNAFVNTPITTAAISSMPRERAGVAGAVGTTGRQVGSNLGVALIGSIVFSIAFSVGGGTALSASLSTPTGGRDFVNGLHYGYGVATLLCLAGIAISFWAFRSRSFPAWEEDAEGRAGEDRPSPAGGRPGSGGPARHRW